MGLEWAQHVTQNVGVEALLNEVATGEGGAMLHVSAGGSQKDEARSKFKIRQIAQAVVLLFPGIYTGKPKDAPAWLLEQGFLTAVVLEVWTGAGHGVAGEMFSHAAGEFVAEKAMKLNTEVVVARQGKNGEGTKTKDNLFACVHVQSMESYHAYAAAAGGCATSFYVSLTSIPSLPIHLPLAHPKVRRPRPPPP